MVDFRGKKSIDCCLERHTVDCEGKYNELEIILDVPFKCDKYLHNTVQD